MVKWPPRKFGMDYVSRLVRAHDNNTIDRVLDEQVKWVLFAHRICIQWSAGGWRKWPLVALVIWRHIYGKHWETSEEIYGSSVAQSGGGTGAFFATPSGSPTGTTVITIPNSGYAFENSGVRAGEITAYRAWKLRDGKLYSLIMDYFLWEPGKVVEGNASEYGQGINGFKNLSDLVKYLDPLSYSDPFRFVIGTVDLWGDIYEHEFGYRASKASIASILDSPHYDAAELREKYGLNHE
jgi:hypothetical protein